MPTNTHIALDKVTVGTATSTITFSSIPSIYTDLFLVRSGGVSAPDEIGLRFNGDSGSNYSYTSMSGYGSTASGRGTNQNMGRGGAAWTSANNTIWNILNYSSTTTFKTTLQRYNDPGDTVGAAITLWRSTAAINSVQVMTLTGSNFTVGTTFSLYGIAAATANLPDTARATGGTITYTNSDVIHTFTSSGTFTPSVPLTCDYLVVAGGGGGNGGKAAAFAGAGGGAGTASTSSLSVAASTAYTVTVGGGGAGGPFNTSKGGDGTSSVFASVTVTGGTGVAFDSSTGGANANYSGGTNVGNPAGGGAGSGANGSGVNGGNGITSSISGSSVTRGGGGSASGGTPGTGGGGQGRAGSQAGGSGETNTGSGGGGAGDAYSGGAGGSGIVIIRYPKA
jgi:hypothetical protein